MTIAAPGVKSKVRKQETRPPAPNAIPADFLDAL
jgi:hypothetical protein